MYISGGGGNTTEATVGLVLGSLERSLQQAAIKLAVFPSKFDAQSATAVLRESEMGSRSYLTALCRYSVLQRTSGQDFVMHMLVREQVAELASPKQQRLAEGRFVGNLIKFLQDITALPKREEEWRYVRTKAPANNNNNQHYKSPYHHNSSPSSFSSSYISTPSLIHARMHFTHCRLAEMMIQDREPDLGKLFELLKGYASQQQRRRVDWDPLEAAQTLSELIFWHRLHTDSFGRLMKFCESSSSQKFVSSSLHSQPIAALTCLYILHERLGKGHEETLCALCNLADTVGDEFHTYTRRADQDRMGKFADRLFRQALHQGRQVHGAEHLLTMVVGTRYAFFLLGRGYMDWKVGPQRRAAADDGEDDESEEEEEEEEKSEEEKSEEEEEGKREEEEEEEKRKGEEEEEEEKREEEEEGEEKEEEKSAEEGEEEGEEEEESQEEGEEEEESEEEEGDDLKTSLRLYDAARPELRWWEWDVPESRQPCAHRRLRKAMKGLSLEALTRISKERYGEQHLVTKELLSLQHDMVRELVNG
ncbi:hypothetical protein PLESTF_001085400 [Pleodorina starrii]|nr:hypothetical protein PLESTF_001085400 [Pleodorina starrii]